MVDSVEVKELAARSKKLKEALLAEVRAFYSAWSDRLSLMTKRHKEEQKKLLARGREKSLLNLRGGYAVSNVGDKNKFMK